MQDKWNRYKRNRQESQRRTRPRHPQILVHGRREQWEPCAKATPHEIVSRKNARSILRVCIWKIVEDGVEKEEGADGEEPGTDNGHDPVDTGTGGPTEPEEADGDTEGTDESWREAFLGCEFALLIELRLNYLIEIVEKRRNDEECAE